MPLSYGIQCRFLWCAHSSMFTAARFRVCTARCPPHCFRPNAFSVVPVPYSPIGYVLADWLITTKYLVCTNNLYGLSCPVLLPQFFVSFLMLFCAVAATTNLLFFLAYSVTRLVNDSCHIFFVDWSSLLTRTSINL